jgi:hypothetical protein
LVKAPTNVTVPLPSDEVKGRATVLVCRCGEDVIAKDFHLDPNRPKLVTLVIFVVPQRTLGFSNKSQIIFRIISTLNGRVEDGEVISMVSTLEKAQPETRTHSCTHATRFPGHRFHVAHERINKAHLIDALRTKSVGTEDKMNTKCVTH